MGKSHRSTLRHREEKDGEIKKLKNIIRRLESDKRKLLSELRTLEEAFEKNIEFLKGKVDDRSLESLIEAAKEGVALKDVPKDESYTKYSAKTKWKCWNCEEGTLVFIPITHRGGDFYMRSCSNKECGKRTPLKKMKEGVDTYNGK